MVTRTVDLIIDCENKGIQVPTTPQPEVAELRPAPKIFKEDCEIHFDRMTAEQVHNFVRGLIPYPAAWTNLNINGNIFENVKIVQRKLSSHARKARCAYWNCKYRGKREWTHGHSSMGYIENKIKN